MIEIKIEARFQTKGASPRSAFGAERRFFPVHVIGSRVPIRVDRLGPSTPLFILIVLVLFDKEEVFAGRVPSPNDWLYVVVAQCPIRWRGHYEVDRIIRQLPQSSQRVGAMDCIGGQTVIERFLRRRTCW